MAPLGCNAASSNFSLAVPAVVSLPQQTPVSIVASDYSSAPGVAVSKRSCSHPWRHCSSCCSGWTPLSSSAWCTGAVSAGLSFFKSEFRIRKITGWRSREQGFLLDKHLTGCRSQKCTSACKPRVGRCLLLFEESRRLSVHMIGQSFQTHSQTEKAYRRSSSGRCEPRRRVETSSSRLST